MNILSAEYALFLLGFGAIHWALPGRGRLLTLLVASYFFYCWQSPVHGVVLAAITLVSHVAARAIGAADVRARRSGVLSLGIGFQLVLLAYFKYGHDPVLPPAGLSFVTFQAMAYMIDVYRGRVQPVRDVLLLATFIGHFPQLTAGPIERARTLIPQLAGPRRLHAEQLQHGVTFLLLGLAKKLVLADRLMFFVGPCFAHPDGFRSGDLAVGIVVMPVALYLDLAAYTDLARGAALLSGIELGRNFHFPFACVSPADFWRRWHMSLSGWIRDYVFLPLGGVRRDSPVRTAANAIVVMTLFGAWHGAGWNFVVWGAAQGLGLAAYYLLRLHILPRVPVLQTRLAAFCGGVLTVAWIVGLCPLFFGPSWSVALQYWSRLAAGDWSVASPPAAMLAVATAGAVVGCHWIGRIAEERGISVEFPAAVTGMAMATLLYVVLFGSAPLGPGFVYARF